MNRLLLALSVWLSLCCAVSGDAWGQGVPNTGSPMVPNGGQSSTLKALCQTASASSHTGDANETILGSCTIPANAMGLNGQLTVTSNWAFTNNADSKTVRVRFGGISGTIYQSVTVTTSASARYQTEIDNTGATNSQIGPSNSSTGFQGASGIAATTSAVDTTQAVTLVLTGQLGTTTDTVTLNSFIVQVWPG